jgi:peptidoglycan hydrolase-like protein with peptidoglycan-binding domain
VRKPAARAQAVPAGRLAKAGGAIARHPREFVGLVMASVATVWIFTNALFLQKGPHPAPIFAARPVTHQAVPLAPPRPDIVAPNTPLPLPAPVVAPAPTTAAGPAAPLSRTQIISSIQRELNRRGFYDGVVDGVWGAHTDAAVRDFLQATGSKVTPDANETLLRAIAGSNAQRHTQAAPHADPIAALLAPSNQVRTPPQAVPPQPVSAPPAPSPRVKAVQRALDDFAYGPVSATGVYDADTRAAIERFERSRGLPVTGQISDRLVRELGGMVGRPLE